MGWQRPLKSKRAREGIVLCPRERERERERERRNGPYKWAVSSFAFVPPFTKEDST